MSTNNGWEVGRKVICIESSYPFRKGNIYEIADVKYLKCKCGENIVICLKRHSYSKNKYTGCERCLTRFLSNNKKWRHIRFFKLIDDEEIGNFTIEQLLAEIEKPLLTELIKDTSVC